MSSLHPSFSLLPGTISVRTVWKSLLRQKIHLLSHCDRNTARTQKLAWAPSHSIFGSQQPILSGGWWWGDHATVITNIIHLSVPSVPTFTTALTVPLLLNMTNGPYFRIYSAGWICLRSICGYYTAFHWSTEYHQLSSEDWAVFSHLTPHSSNMNIPSLWPPDQTWHQKNSSSNL